MKNPLRKIPYETSREILSRFEISDDSKEIIAPENVPCGVITQLHEKGLTLDLIRFISHALPTREAIFWAYLSIKQYDPEINTHANVLEDVQKWIFEPQEAQRLICRKHHEKISTDKAVSWLCLAVDWNGSGSIIAPDQPAVLPKPYLHAKALLGAVGLLIPLGEASKAKFILFLKESAIQIAQGMWDEESVLEGASL